MECHFLFFGLLLHEARMGELEQRSQAEVCKFDETADDDEAVKKFFDDVAAKNNRNDGKVSRENLRKGLELFKSPLNGLEEILTLLQQSGSDVDMDLKDFTAKMRKVHRIRGNRIQWVQSLGVDGVLARHLFAGPVFNELEGIKSMTDDDLVAALDSFRRDVLPILKEQREKLKTGASSAKQITTTMSKFTGDFKIGKYGNVEMFERGLESDIGSPDPKILKGILRENVMADESQERYITTNYSLVTSDRLEYALLLGNPVEYRDERTKKVGKIPSFLMEVAKGNNKDHAGPSEAELMELENEFEPLKREYKNSGGKSDKFPGDVGDVRHFVDFKVSPKDAVTAEDLLTEEIAALWTDLVVDTNAWAAKNSCIITVALPETYGKLSGVKKTKFGKLLNHLESLVNSRGSVVVENARTLIYCQYPQYPNKETLQKQLETISLPELWKQAGDSSATKEKCIASILSKFDAEIAASNEPGAKRMQGRNRRTLRELMSLPDVKRAKLRVEEAIQAYQYTGPSYQVDIRPIPDTLPAFESPFMTDRLVLVQRWNSVLRFDRAGSFRPANLYTTSIHVLVSATLKLSRVTAIPPKRKVFRGLGVTVLGQEWFEANNDRGVRSGVELGFLSTTLKQSVALNYSGASDCRTGIIFELDIGAIDCGARLDGLSQYPGEEELLFPPLCHLEVVGDPRLQARDNTQVLVVSVKTNINQKSLTIEEILSQRKQTVVSIGENLSKEIKFDMKLISSKQASASKFDSDLQTFKDEEEIWFNNDTNLKEALSTLLARKESTIIENVKAWMKTNPRDFEAIFKDVVRRGKTELMKGIFESPEQLLQVVQCQSLRVALPNAQLCTECGCMQTANESPGPQR